MELGSEHPRYNKNRWAYKIKRAEEVGILFNSTRVDDDICG